MLYIVELRRLEITPPFCLLRPAQFKRFRIQTSAGVSPFTGAAATKRKSQVEVAFLIGFMLKYTSWQLSICA